MNNDQFEAQMRALERYHGLQVEQDAFIVLRVDGRSFSAFTARFQKPFDDRFHQLMITTARALLANLQGIYAYTESDEISVLLPRDTTLFDREVEKLVSISASVATGAFTTVALVGRGEEASPPCSQQRSLCAQMGLQSFCHLL